jgi:hypothetical protein
MKLRELMVKHGFPTTHYRGILWGKQLKDCASRNTYR